MVIHILTHDNGGYRGLPSNRRMGGYGGCPPRGYGSCPPRGVADWGRVQSVIPGATVKLTNWSEAHHGHRFVTGLNQDRVPFNPTGQCRPGGIYGCALADLSEWLCYDGQEMYYCRSVTIPDDAQVYVENHHKFKADRLVLGEPVPIAELSVWQDPEHARRACQLSGLALRYIPAAVQTDEMCVAAVTECGHALRYVAQLTLAIVLAAVRRHGEALQWVEHLPQFHLEEVWLAALQQNPCAIYYIASPTEAMCLAVVTCHLNGLMYIPEPLQTHQVCLAAVTKCGLSIRFLPRPNRELCLAAVKVNGLALQYIARQTESMCQEAVSRTPYALRYVKRLTESICLTAVQRFDWAVQWIPAVWRTEAVLRQARLTKIRPAFTERTDPEKLKSTLAYPDGRPVVPCLR